MNGSAGLASASLQNHWVTDTHDWKMAQYLQGRIMECQQQVWLKDCVFSCSVVVLLEGRESAALLIKEFFAHGEERRDY